MSEQQNNTSLKAKVAEQLKVEKEKQRTKQAAKAAQKATKKRRHFFFSDWSPRTKKTVLVLLGFVLLGVLSSVHYHITGGEGLESVDLDASDFEQFFDTVSEPGLE